MQGDSCSFLSQLEYKFCVDVGKYEKLTKIGQGTFGEVFKSKHRTTNKLYALKKFLTEKETNCFSITSIREIKLLQYVKHENIVSLKEMCFDKGSMLNKGAVSVYLVLEFCEHDLAGILANYKISFSLGQIKMMLRMMFSALNYLHENKIIHRDLKSSNILVTKDGVLKLADFGLARFVNSCEKEKENPKLTNKVVTLWYRAPELLLGSRDYSYPIDMWAAGCIMAELWTRCPLLQGKSEQMQLKLINLLCGSISVDEWPDVTKLELFKKFQFETDLKRSVKDYLFSYIANNDAMDLLEQLFVYNPNCRINADNVLDHRLFWSNPLPCCLKPLLSTVKISNFEMYASRNEKREIIKLTEPKYSKSNHHSVKYVSSQRMNNLGDVGKRRHPKAMKELLPSKTLNDRGSKGGRSSCIKKVGHRL